MRALDLFCGAGGVAQGLIEAGFDEVFGVDIIAKHGRKYPGTFICGDALFPPVDLRRFDFIWASPPCQVSSQATRTAPVKRDHADLIPETRDLLQRANIPYCIENVPEANLRADVVLRGSMFGLPVIRRRIFEVEGFTVQFILDPTHGGLKTTRGELAVVAGGGGGVNANNRKGKYHEAIKKRNCAQGWRDAMGIAGNPGRDAVAQMIPPAYACWIGQSVLQQLAAV